MPGADHPTPAERDALAIALLGWLATEPQHLEAFMAETGVNAGEFTTLARSPGFRRGLLEWLASHEDTLLAFCANSGRDPASIAGVLRQIRPS